MPNPSNQKIAVIYTCLNCDAQSAKWTGQCLECGAWGTIDAAGVSSGAYNAAPAAAAARAKSRTTPPPRATLFADLRGDGGRRQACGIGEIDRVFGGGIMPGSVTLLGGEPGIGKSTLALLLAARLASPAGRVLYVSGEESAGQVKARADRLGITQNAIAFLAETDVDAVIGALENAAPVFAVIDSVQTLSASYIPSEAGAMNQLRGAAARLVAYAKSKNTPVLLIGHVTKDGHLAGPKTLEHMVDTVLSFEGERAHGLRILRAVKNRFGSTDETGIFDMQNSGLVEIKNPSAYLLDERRSDIPGSIVTCILEGTRPLLVEIQALVQKTAFGYPTRRASGFDQSRLEMLLAVLARRGGIDLGSHDVFINVVGGIKVKEPAADLAVVLALSSAHANTPVAEGLAAWGEVGLGGEIRSVAAADRRLREAAALGLKRAITALPRSGAAKKPASLDVADVASVREAVAAVRRA